MIDLIISVLIVQQQPRITLDSVNYQDFLQLVKDTNKCDDYPPDVPLKSLIEILGEPASKATYSPVDVYRWRFTNYTLVVRYHYGAFLDWTLDQ
jgi:hypothetical protein